MPRPRKTAEQARLAGTYRPDRHGFPGEVPRGEFGHLVKPSGLPKGASSAWDRFIAKASWLDEARQPEAILFCQLWSEFEEDPKVFTASRIAQMRACMGRLGLSEPHQRVTRVEAFEEEADDPFADFLAKRN